jgi:uncharacterized RDD family membrane protein YckC
MTDPQLQQKRFIAAAIDIAILIALGVVLALAAIAVSCSGAAAHVDFLATHGGDLIGVAISLVSFGYVIGRDVVAGDRSVGKKLMGIRVVTQMGAPIGIMESIKRNALFAPGVALGVVLSVVGLLPGGGCLVCLLWPLRMLAGIAALGALIWELIQIAQNPDGVRVGDQMAGTRVTF